MNTQQETTDTDMDEPVELVPEAEREQSGVACFTTLTSSLKDWDEQVGKIGRKK